MLKYDKRNQYNLIVEAQKLMFLMQRDALVRNQILTAILNEWAPNKEAFNELIEDPKFKKNENLVMDTLFYMDTIGDKPDEFVFFNYFAYSVKKMDINKFLENPYIKNIKFDNNFELNNNNIKLKVEYFKEYEAQLSNTSKRERNLTVKPQIGYFDKKVEFPVLLENDEAWMSITPSEINTMEHHLEHMKGNVIVFGLGLGYFAYMSAIKDSVDSITIIEANKDIIDIFNNNIFNQIDDKIKEKINIIHGDAKEVFLNKEYMDSFNSCFVDIWKNAIDGAPLYTYFKENEKELKIKPRYWLEEDIILHYQDDLMAYITYTILKDIHSNKSDKEAYLKAIKTRFFVDKIDKYFKKNKCIIRDKNDIYSLIFDNNIMKKIFKLSN